MEIREVAHKFELSLIRLRLVTSANWWINFKYMIDYGNYNKLLKLTNEII